jgi:hypothetical protein
VQVLYNLEAGEEMSITLTIPPELTRLLSGPQMINAMQAATKAAAAVGQDRIAKYPGARRRKMVFASDRQRRGFFARLRSGAIEVPYRRGSSPGSETLGRRWHIRQHGAIGHVLTNDASYAPLVHGADTQAAYHKGNWKTDEGLAKELESDGSFEQIIEQALTAHLGGI